MESVSGRAVSSLSGSGQSSAAKQFVVHFGGGGAENARVENAELENPPPNRRGGKRGTGKRGNLKVMESRRCRKCAT